MYDNGANNEIKENITNKIFLSDKEEEERLPQFDGQYPSDVNQKENSPIPRGVNRDNIDVFDRVKGHNLLGICIFILCLIYLSEFIRACITKQPSTDISNAIIEIIKILIFSLTGYLFGTRNNNI